MDNQDKQSSTGPEQLSQSSQIANPLPRTPLQTATLYKQEPRTRKIVKIAETLGVTMLVVVGTIAITVIRSKLSTDSEQHKLFKEVSSLHLSSSKPDIIGFENEPANLDLLISDTYPGVHLTLLLPKLHRAMKLIASRANYKISNSRSNMILNTRLMT